MVTSVPWRAHLREQSKHKIKIEINPGKGHADCPCEEGRGKGGAFAESVTCQRPCQGINVNYFESS